MDENGGFHGEIPGKAWDIMGMYRLRSWNGGILMIYVTTTKKLAVSEDGDANGIQWGYIINHVL